MKIKEFKKQISSMEYDIPNVLDNIRDIAYNQEYHSISRKESKFKAFLALTPTLCLILICAFIFIPKNLSQPKDDIPSEGENNFESVDGCSTCREKEMTIYNFYSQVDDGSKAEEIFEGISQKNGSCMLEFKDEANSYYILTDEQFHYLSEYLENNPKASFVSSCHKLSEEFNIDPNYYYAIVNAYQFIINKK